MFQTPQKNLKPQVRFWLFYFLWVLLPVVAMCGQWSAYFTERQIRLQTRIDQNGQHLQVYVRAIKALMEKSGDYTTIPVDGATVFQTLDLFLVSQDNRFLTRPRFSHRGTYISKTALLYAAEQTDEVVAGVDTSYRFTECLRAVVSLETPEGSALLIAELDMREIGQQPWYFVWDEVLTTVCAVCFLWVGLVVFKPYVLIAESPDKNLQEVLNTLETVTQSFNAAELRQAFRAMPFVAVILDDDLRILFMSDLAGRSMGTSEGAALSVPFDVFLPASCRDGYMQEIKAFVRSDKTVKTFDVNWPPGIKSVTLSKVKSASRTLLVVVAN